MESVWNIFAVFKLISTMDQNLPRPPFFPACTLLTPPTPTLPLPPASIDRARQAP